MIASGDFLLTARVALQVQKVRVAVATRLYSSLVESFVRGHPKYSELLILRKDKNADRKKTALFTKKLLVAQLKAEGLTVEDFNNTFEKLKENNITYVSLLETEKQAFKNVKPLLEDIPLWNWIKSVKGLGLNFGVKLLCYLRDVKRFPNPSKLRKYCGTVPGSKMTRGQEAHFNPELKGILLGQISKNFLMANSQYRKVYDEKKQAYITKYAVEIAKMEEKKLQKQKITKEDWTKIKIHNYSLKAMVNRFLVELWQAAWLVEGKEPPTNIYILNDPKHNKEPMIVPVTEDMVQKEQKSKN
ncbi:MAG: transposase [Nanoarchaeota archaeon]|nr:transposase [Nanoarchaeota archaeon]